MINRNAVEFTIRKTCFGKPVIYVRRAVPECNNVWEWGKWRPANDSECNAALIKLMELNR